VLVSGGCYSVVDSMSCQIGGDKVTDILTEFLAREFYQKYKVDIQESKRGYAKLKAQAESCKHILSTLDTAHCYVESLYDGMDFSTNVTRARFENELSKIMTEIMAPINTLLDRCNLSPSDISKVVLSGGTTKVIKVQKQLASLFPEAEVLSSLAGDEVIAVGAAVQASHINKNPPAEARPAVLAISKSLVAFSECLPGGEAVLVPADTPVPARRSLSLTLPEGDSNAVSVSIGWGSKELIIAHLRLEEVDGKSKVVVAVHIHRDGSCHFTLTDKTSGKSSDATLKTQS